MLKRVFVLALLLVAPAALADVYQWEDSSGVVHFTDNHKKVPLEFRKKAKKTVDSGGTAAQSPAAVIKSPPSEPAPSSADFYGNLSEESWRSRFAALRQEIKNAEARLVAKKEEQAVLRRKKANYHRAQDRLAYNAVGEEVVAIEQEVMKIQARLAILASEADQARVPLFWRQ